LLAILFLVFSLLPSLLAFLLQPNAARVVSSILLVISIDQSIAPSIGVGKFEAGDVERQPMDGAGWMSVAECEPLASRRQQQHSSSLFFFF
jgi:hypothetical protein